MAEPSTTKVASLKFVEFKPHQFDSKLKLELHTPLRKYPIFFETELGTNMILNECEDILSFLAKTPMEVRRLTEGLTDDEARWKPPTGEFSVVENICHLCDIELDGYTVRIKRILEEDQPFLADLNGAQLAKERDYNNQDLNAALDAFTQARELNVRTIGALSPEQLVRTGTFENTGSITLGRLLEMMREHDDAHVDEMTTLRGKFA